MKNLFFAVLISCLWIDIGFADDVFKNFSAYEVLSNQIKSAISDNIKLETVGKGFDLKTMAETYYGSGLGWPLLWFLNSDSIRDPELVKAGTKLKIPRLRPGISAEEAELALDNAYQLVYWIYANDGRHSKAQRQWALGQALTAGVDVQSKEWQGFLTEVDKTYAGTQKQADSSLVKTIPKTVIVNQKLTNSLIEAAKSASETEMTQIVVKAEKNNTLKDLAGDLEVEAAKTEADSKPEIHFALALTYGRLGLKGKEYGALLKAEEAAKKPGVSFNLSIIYGRKQLLESDVDADKFLVGTLEISSIPQGARIVLDGRELGETPYIVPNQKAGAHQIQLTKEGFLKSEQTIEVVFNKNTKFEQKLSRKLIGLDMKKVDGGVFTVGGADVSVKSAHRVSLKSFRISSTEITQAQFLRVMGFARGRFSGEFRPSESLSWYEAVQFCNKLSEYEGLDPAYSIDSTQVDPNNTNKKDKFRWTVTIIPNANGYRLPTEAQWEYAAKGGKNTKATTFAGSQVLTTVAWYADNSVRTTHSVATKKDNELGLFDMSGNVWEWCWDWYAPYLSAEQVDPAGPLSGESRVLRGGGYDSDSESQRLYFRGSLSPSEAYDDVGFRVVLPD